MSDASKPDPKQVYRLHDMSVEEVSVVDRAANRRKFLLVKREGDMGIGAEVTTNADGSLTVAKPAAQTETTTAAADGTTTESAAKAIDPEVKATFSSVVEEALNGLAKAKQLLASSGDAADVVDAVVKVADDLADSVFAFLGIEDGDKGTVIEPADAPAAPAGMGKRLEVRRAKRIIAKDAGDKAAATVLAKVGAKMSKDRLTRFQTAMQVFQDLLNEVLPAAGPSDTEKAKGAPSAGIAEQKPGEKPAVQPATAKTAKRDAATEKLLAEAATTIKKQAEQLNALRATTQASNGASVEVSKARGEDVSWPLDMNEPVNEKTSGKEFFG